jgi:hypothetical protein
MDCPEEASGVKAGVTFGAVGERDGVSVGERLGRMGTGWVGVGGDEAVVHPASRREKAIIKAIDVLAFICVFLFDTGCMEAGRYVGAVVCAGPV